jgi:hypothetical protein
MPTINVKSVVTTITVGGADAIATVGTVPANINIFSPTAPPIKITSAALQLISVSEPAPQEINIYGPGGPPGPPGPAGPPGSGIEIWGETPIGTVNGINKNYTSAYPYRPNLCAVFLNGIRQRRIDDYTETGSQSFSFVNAPLPGDSLSIDYMQP